MTRTHKISGLVIAAVAVVAVALSQRSRTAADDAGSASPSAAASSGDAVASRHVARPPTLASSPEDSERAAAFFPAPSAPPDVAPPSGPPIADSAAAPGEEADDPAPLVDPEPEYEQDEPTIIRGVAVVEVPDGASEQDVRAVLEHHGAQEIARLGAQRRIELSDETVLELLERDLSALR